MKKILYTSCLISVIVITMSLLASCGGGSDAAEEDKPTPVTPEPKQEDPPVVQDISSENVDLSSNEPTFKFAAPQQVDGKAELTATLTRADAVVILGSYNTEKGCYEFDLSILEDSQPYTFKVKVYNKEGKVVIESKEKTITMPDTSDSSKINPSGNSDGTRAGL